MAKWKPDQRVLDFILANFKRENRLDTTVKVYVQYFPDYDHISDKVKITTSYTGREIIKEIKKNTTIGREMYEDYYNDWKFSAH